MSTLSFTLKLLMTAFTFVCLNGVNALPSVIKDFNKAYFLRGVEFSAVFTNYTVLQQEPYHAALYGSADTSNVEIILAIKNEINNKFEIIRTTSSDNREWKVILPSTYSNGGNYTLSVDCLECLFSDYSDIIYHVSFGDVFICSGQSNMKLAIKYTFSRNYLYKNITSLGKYSNIRFFTKDYLSTNDSTTYILSSHSSAWYSTSINTIYNIGEFSATCFYFAQYLIDKYGMDNQIFGLILTAHGGSKIQEWMKGNSLYNGMILPFVNMTIKSILWYQGENNLYEIGTGLNADNYGEMLQKMIVEWRYIWSIEPGTTSSYVPFGFVELAGGTSEGYEDNIAPFRYIQNKIVFDDNINIPNLFIASGHDAGDPFNYYYVAEHLPYNISNATYNIIDDPWFMGPVHPRSKIYIGQRLARYGYKVIYKDADTHHHHHSSHHHHHHHYHHQEAYVGPLIESCYVKTININMSGKYIYYRHNSNDHAYEHEHEQKRSDKYIRKQIVIEFNQSMLYDEYIKLQPFVAWYNHSLTVQHWNSIEIEYDSLNKWDYISDDWIFIGDNKYSIYIDIPFKFNNKMITGIKYAWKDRACCGDLNLHKYPCPMNMCPIISSKSHLPAIPFYAKIINNKCVFGYNGTDNNNNNNNNNNDDDTIATVVAVGIIKLTLHMSSRYAFYLLFFVLIINVLIIIYCVFCKKESSSEFNDHSDDIQTETQ